jgi:hypothetical protein
MQAISNTLAAATGNRGAMAALVDERYVGRNNFRTLQEAR